MWQTMVDQASAFVLRYKEKLYKQIMIRAVTLTRNCVYICFNLLLYVCEFYKVLLLEFVING